LSYGSDLKANNLHAFTGKSILTCNLLVTGTIFRMSTAPLAEEQSSHPHLFGSWRMLVPARIHWNLLLVPAEIKAIAEPLGATGTIVVEASAWVVSLKNEGAS
jgi:hypothetical protein